MPITLYQNDNDDVPHRGAIYSFRPIFWLEPPLWLLRNIQYAPLPGTASVQKPELLRDAFRTGYNDNQEDVIARAKVRYVIVLSSDLEARNRIMHDVLVAPTYTLDASTHRPEFLEQVRTNKYPWFFHLYPDPDFPAIGECYINFRQIQALHKGFLQEGKLQFTLTPDAIRAVLDRYKQYLSVDRREASR